MSKEDLIFSIEGYVLRPDHEIGSFRLVSVKDNLDCYLNEVGLAEARPGAELRDYPNVYYDELKCRTQPWGALKSMILKILRLALMLALISTNVGGSSPVDIKDVPYALCVGIAGGAAYATGGLGALTAYGWSYLLDVPDPCMVLHPAVLFDDPLFAPPNPSNVAVAASPNDLGGINFTSIKLNYISIYRNNSDGINLDLVLKSQKSEESRPGIDPINSTLISATAFRTGLAVPNDKFWVNLAPWEPDRIIDDELKQAEVGRIMLEADLQMKRDFSNYGNPCASQIGKEYWMFLDGKREILVQQCMRKFPGEIKDRDNVYFRPVTRHWIIPDKVYAYTNGSEIYIINATLTISSDPVTDHASFVVYNQDVRTLSRGCQEELNRSAMEFSRYAKELEDSMILPYVVADVNQAERYEDLRNVYFALALAQWYKSNIDPDMDIFREGLDSSDSAALNVLGPWDHREIWEDYVYSFENGEYKCWENTTTRTSEGTKTKCQLRSQGGVDFYDINDKLVEIDGVPPEVRYQVERAVAEGFIDDGDEVLFGSRVHATLSPEAPASGSGSGSGSDSGAAPTRTEAHGHSDADGGGNETSQDEETPRVTCPEGWIGPNEKGECRRYIPLIPTGSA